MPQNSDPLEDHTVDQNTSHKPSSPKSPPGPPAIDEKGADSQQGSGFATVPGAGPNPTGGVEYVDD